jgi:hypothetical protein
MRRLGMLFHKNVEYPLDPGAEYVLHRGDAPPELPLALIAVE